MLNVPPRNEDLIAMAQNDLLSELQGTTYRVNGRFRYVAGLGLTVDAAGLTILEQSVFVKEVTEDSPAKVHRNLQKRWDSKSLMGHYGTVND